MYRNDTKDGRSSFSFSFSHAFIQQYLQLQLASYYTIHKEYTIYMSLLPRVRFQFQSFIGYSLLWRFRRFFGFPLCLQGRFCSVFLCIWCGYEAAGAADFIFSTWGSSRRFDFQWFCFWGFGIPLRISWFEYYNDAGHVVATRTVSDCVWCQAGFKQLKSNIEYSCETLCCNISLK